MSQTIAEASTREAVQRYIEGLNALDPELATSAYAADAVIRYPGRSPMGIDEFRSYLGQVRDALSNLDFATREVFESEHGVAARWTFTATTRRGHSATREGIDSWLIGGDGLISVGGCGLRPLAAPRGARKVGTRDI